MKRKFHNKDVRDAKADKVKKLGFVIKCYEKKENGKIIYYLETD